MATPPARTDLADTYPNPSNAVFRTGIGKLHDFLMGLLGTTGNAVDARAALGIGDSISNRNLVVNGDFSVNQRVYGGTLTTAANQVTLDRWRVVVSGQAITFGAASPGRTVTAPAGGMEQIIEAGWVRGGVHTLSWGGTATATVNGAAITSGGQTASLATNTAVTLRFTGGTVSDVQFERGSSATPREYRPPLTELMLCQRDYAKSYAIATAPGNVTALGRYWFSGNVSGSILGFVPFPVSMRIAPTVTPWDGNGNINSTLSFTAAGAFISRTATAANITDKGFEVGASVGTDVVISGQWTAATGF